MRVFCVNSELLELLFGGAAHPQLWPAAEKGAAELPEIRPLPVLVQANVPYGIGSLTKF